MIIRINYLIINADNLLWIQNPIQDFPNMATFSLMEKEQLINILSNFELKSIFKEVELTNFWIMLMEEFPEITLEARRVARIWKRGGGGFFERVRKMRTTWTRIFIVLESVTHGLSEN